MIVGFGFVLTCACAPQNDIVQGVSSEASNEASQDPPKIPKLSKSDKKQTRARYSWGGTGSACGPSYVLHVFADGRIYCEGEDYYDGDGDCPPDWGGETSMPNSKAKEWIDYLREEIGSKKLGSDDCDGAWSVFRVYSGEEIDVKTKNLSCENSDGVIDRIETSGMEIWREYCLEFKPPATEEDGEVEKKD